MNALILEADQISKKYSHDGAALRPLSLSIRSFDRVALLGPSGAGKTTLAKILKGYLIAETGEFNFLGKRSSQKLLRHNPQIQLIFQNPYESISPNMKIIDMLIEPLIFYRNCNKKTAVKIINTLSSQLNISCALLQKYPVSLSGGERQRIAIIRALSVEPKLLICDEILSALDQPLQMLVLDVLKIYQQRHGAGVIFITHDFDIAKEFCNQALVLDKGIVCACGPMSSVLQNRSIEFVDRSLRAIDWLSTKM